MTNEERYESILNKHNIELDINGNGTYTLYDKVMDCYVKGRDIVEYCMSDFSDIYGAQVNLNINERELDEIEADLQDKADNGDKDAADVLSRIGDAAENLRFVISDAFFKVDLYKVCELQETRTSKSAKKEKDLMER